jgi:hypothetical protein
VSGRPLCVYACMGCTRDELAGQRRHLVVLAFHQDRLYETPGVVGVLCGGAVTDIHALVCCGDSFVAPDIVRCLPEGPRRKAIFQVRRRQESCRLVVVHVISAVRTVYCIPVGPSLIFPLRSSPPHSCIRLGRRAKDPRPSGCVRE